MEICEVCKANPATEPDINGVSVCNACREGILETYLLNWEDD